MHFVSRSYYKFSSSRLDGALPKHEGAGGIAEAACRRCALLPLPTDGMEYMCP